MSAGLGSAGFGDYLDFSRFLIIPRDRPYLPGGPTFRTKGILRG
jgi:hypothetical protein